MGSIKLPHASGNSMSIGAPASNPSGDLELKLPATVGTAGQVLKNSDTAGTLEFGPPPRPYRNLIINGAMNVAQRGTSSTGHGMEVVDRWNHYRDNVDENPTFAQVDVGSGTTPYQKGFRKSFKITNGNQTSGAGTDDYITLDYKIEAQDIANSGWDYTSASSYITLSFWVKSSVAQTFYGYLRSQDGTSKNYPFETGSLSADTWTKVTKTIPGVSGLQFDNDNGHGLQFRLLLFRGTYRTGSVTLNQWGNWNNLVRTPDNTSTWYTTNDATFEITGLQLEVGEVATEFEHKSYADEFQRCKRYYQQYPEKPTADNYTTLVSSCVACHATTEAYWAVDFRPSLRTPPSFSHTGNFRANGSGVNNVGLTALGIYHNGTSSSFMYVRVASGFTAGIPVVISTNNDATACVKFDAEL